MKQGWLTKTLGDICVVDWGNTDLTKSSYVEGGKFLAVSAAVCDGRIGHKEHAKHTPVLSAIGAQCGRMFLPEEDFTAIKNTITLTPRDGTCTGKFLYQLLTYIELPKRGAAQPFIAKGDTLKFSIPVPPLAEQQRIVGLLDEAFAGIATAKANAEKNLQNARALFESHLQSVFTHRGPGWVETTLDKISTNLDSKRVPITKNVRSNGKYPYYGASGIVDCVSEYIFDSNTLLVSEDGANLLARSMPIAFSVSGKYWVNNHAHILKFENMATQRFVEFYLKSIKLDEYITGAAQPKLNQKALNSIPIPIPKSVETQAKLVESVESLQAETQRLARLYERKLAALEALKKSVLHQAFTGQL